MKKGVGVFFAVLLAAGLGGGAFYRFIYTEQKGQTASGNVVYVNSVSALAGLGSGSGLIPRYSGIVEPLRTSEIKKGEREVEEVYVKQGDTVKVGDRLFAYSTKDDEDKIAQDQIDLERSQNEIENKKKENEQLEKRSASTKMTEEERLALTATILANESTIKAAEYDIKSKELEISQLQENIKTSVVKSDLDGVVKSINDGGAASTLDTGNSDVYITIMEVGKYRVKGSVNEQNRMQISPGDDVLVFSRLEAGRSWEGTITEIQLENGQSNSSDSFYYGGGSSMGSSTSYPFYVELKESADLVLGQHVYIEKDSNQNKKKSGIWLPDYYFETDDEGISTVWAAKNKSTLEKREVELGSYDEEMGTYEILSGLGAEDYIVQPSPDLVNGLPVICVDTVEEYSGYAEDGTGSGEFGEMDDEAFFMDGFDEDAMLDDLGSAYDFYEDDMGSVYEIYEDDMGSSFEFYEDELGSAYEDYMIEDMDDTVYVIGDDGVTQEIIPDEMVLPDDMAPADEQG